MKSIGDSSAGVLSARALPNWNPWSQLIPGSFCWSEVESCGAASDTSIQFCAFEGLLRQDQS